MKQFILSMLEIYHHPSDEEPLFLESVVCCHSNVTGKLSL